MADVVCVETPVLDVVHGLPSQARGRVVEARGAAPVVVHGAATAYTRLPTLSVLAVRLDADGATVVVEVGRRASRPTVAVAAVAFAACRATSVAATVPRLVGQVTVVAVVPVLVPLVAVAAPPVVGARAVVQGPVLAVRGGPRLLGEVVCRGRARLQLPVGT